MSEEQKILAQCRSGPSNPARVGFDVALKSIQDSAKLAMSRARVKASSISAICAGLGGIGRLESGVHIRARLAVVFPGTAIKVCTDMELALAAAPEGSAIVLVAGTGSAAIGRSVDGMILLAGGYGPLLGDGGSAYDIGRRAVIACLRERDRHGSDSDLGKQILRQLGCSGWVGVQERVRANADDVFPKVFPVIANAADAGNETARSHLRDAAGELTTLVRDLAERLGLLEAKFNLIRTGGAVGCSRFFDNELEENLRAAVPRARIGPLPVPAAEMAARLALQLISTHETSEKKR